MILGVIPARGGSKGIPRKNIRLFNGKPLIVWSIEAAQASRLLDDYLVSTEDSEIASVAERFGSKIDVRSKELATDDVVTIDVLRDLLVRRPEVKHVVLLQPTSPNRYMGLIDQCIQEYLDHHAESLATGFICKFRPFGEQEAQRRQDIHGFFYDDGNVYVLSRECVLQRRWSGPTTIRKIIAKSYNYEIDDETDWTILEYLMRHHTK